MRTVTGDVEIGHWVSERTGEQWCEGKGSTMAFVDDDHKIMCGLVFFDFNGRTVWAGLAIDGSFSSPEIFFTVADYVFNQLGCEWVRCKVARSNVKSTRLVESVGFELETLLKDSHPTGDEAIYRMNKSHCQWLDLEQSKSVWKKPN